MPDNIPKIFSMDTGIEQVIKGANRESSRLPKNKASILPSDDHLDIQLNQLFKESSLDDHILSFLKPVFHDKTILIPAHYQATLRDIQKIIKQMLRENKTKTKSKALEKTSLLLEEEVELMELLNTYRNLLHQG